MPPATWTASTGISAISTTRRGSTICLGAIACSMSCSRTTGQRFSKLAAAPAGTSSMRRDAIRTPGSSVSTFRTRCSRRRAHPSRGRGSPIASTCIRRTRRRSICRTSAGEAHAGRVFISYTLSMIPPWRQVLPQALEAVGPGGRLHIVDFGQQEGWPRWFKAVLFAWLRQFSVHPRAELEPGTHQTDERDRRYAGLSTFVSRLRRLRGDHEAGVICRSLRRQ